MRKGGRGAVEEIKALLEKEAAIVVWGAREVRRCRGSWGDAPLLPWFGRPFYIHMNGIDFIEWCTEEVPPLPRKVRYVIFVFPMGTGVGSSSMQLTGQFDIYLNGEYVLSFHVTKESKLWRRGECALYYMVKGLMVAPPGMSFRLDDHIREECMASSGLGALKVPAGMVRRGENVLRVSSRRAVTVGRRVLGRSVTAVPSKRWFRVEFSYPKRYIANEHDLREVLEVLSKGREHPEVAGYCVFFGDIHSHSGESKGPACGAGTIDENYTYARDVAALDFFSLTDHDWQILDYEDWEVRLKKADEYYEKGVFVTLPGFEWTSRRYGHRNVYYRDTANCPLIRSLNGSIELRPTRLWEELRQRGIKAITVPHHTNVSPFPVDWSFHDPEYERLVEVYSSWGNSEYYGAPLSWPPHRVEGCSVQDGLARGYKLGIIASSDSHDGHPGNAHGIRGVVGSGLVAVLASELSRDAVFNALYERRCYATTGARILLEFSVEGQLMGSEITVTRETSPRHVKIYVEGTHSLSHVEVIRDNDIIYRRRITGKRAVVEFTDREPLTNTSYYYVRVTQEDYEMAWSSPIWVSVE